MALIGPVLEAIQGLHSLPMSYLWDASINGLTWPKFLQGNNVERAAEWLFSGSSVDSPRKTTVVEAYASLSKSKPLDHIPESKWQKSDTIPYLFGYKTGVSPL